MSVLLQAGNLALKTSRDKQRKKRKLQVVKCSKAKAAEFNATPPKSSTKTLVWHWELDGVPTTVMLSTQTNEVWCNGETIHTIDDFGDFEGAILDFCILTEETQANHKARIKRTKTDDTDCISHQLFVNGYQIVEHEGTPIVRPPSRDAAASDGVPEYHPLEADVPAFLSGVPNPPSYDDVLADISDKKND